MKCQLCQGQYQERLVTRTYRRDGKIVVVDDVPAEVCNLCGDILLRPETVELIQDMLKMAEKATEFAPVVRLPRKVA
ncbi:MAG: type II toxin-antitoxin system MqsA family antitoxin [Chloroflexota bacterium]|nr:type II toxin-antitoxin system MqsA family antitoxin [Chloroflexota bacterium]